MIDLKGNNIFQLGDIKMDQKNFCIQYFWRIIQ